MSKPDTTPAIVCRDVSKSYPLGRVTLDVLKGVDMEVRQGEFGAIVGASGSGKSTLLHLMGLLDRADSGSIQLNGTDLADLSSRRRNRIRCRDVGFVFQFYHLLPELNVLENVLLPAKVDASTLGWLGRRKALRERAVEALEMVGLEERLKHRPKELSGGERQRVAIARALMNSPKLLLADEPTGNLDSKMGRRILKLLHRCNKEYGLTVVMVTHDDLIAKEATRYKVLKDGHFIS
jgi:lipoprotein-releasing system ATP-binding protein